MFLIYWLFLGEEVVPADEGHDGVVGAVYDADDAFGPDSVLEDLISQLENLDTVEIGLGGVEDAVDGGFLGGYDIFRYGLVSGVLLGHG